MDNSFFVNQVGFAPFYIFQSEFSPSILNNNQFDFQTLNCFPIQNSMTYTHQSDYSESQQMIISNEHQEVNNTIQNTQQNQNANTNNLSNKIQIESNSEIEIPHITWVIGERNKKVLVVDGYYFHRDRDNIYRCKYKRTHDCKMRILLENDGSVSIKSETKVHVDHPRDYYNHVQKQRNREAARNPLNINKSALEIATETYIKGSTMRLSSSTKIIRKEKGIMPKPKTIDEIEMTDMEKQFFICKSKTIYLFGDKELYPILKTTPMIFIDGTFRSCPSLFFISF